MQNVTFVTGSDTGVGKTLVTALIVRHLRSSGINALGIKPFCTGSHDDVDLISAVQGDVLPQADVNPFFAPRPVAPLLAFPRRRHPIRLTSAVSHVRRIAAQCEHLVVEGCGGLWVPIADGLYVLDLIQALNCKVVVVVPNRLGAINQALLCMNSLEAARTKQVKVVLNTLAAGETIVSSNLAVIRSILGRHAVEWLPFLGAAPKTVPAVRINAVRENKTLARICDPNTFSVASLANRKRRSKYSKWGRQKNK